MLRMLIVILGVLIGTGSARAASLHTAAVFVQDQDKFHCIVSNVGGGKAVEVKATMLRADGSVRLESTLDVPPGETRLLAIIADGSDDLRCSFSFPGSKRKLRAASRYFVDGLTDSVLFADAS